MNRAPEAVPYSSKHIRFRIFETRDYRDSPPERETASDADTYQKPITGLGRETANARGDWPHTATPSPFHCK